MLTMVEDSKTKKQKKNTTQVITKIYQGNDDL